MLHCPTCASRLLESNKAGIDSTAVMLVECRACGLVFSMDELKKEILAP